MKKLLLLLFIFPLFISCSGDDEDKDNGLAFVQIKVYMGDGSVLKGKSAIFYGKVTDCNNRDDLFFAKDSKGESVFSIGRGDLVSGAVNEDNSAVASFFWSNLGTIYGKPKPNQDYTIYIKLSDSNYSYKTFNIEDKNKLITVKFPNKSGGAEFIEAEWSIEDYKGL